MLPIGGKPVIEHLLENVSTVPHARMTLVASRGVNALRQFVGSGERWGLDIDLMSSRPNEPVSSLKRRQPSLFNGKTLIVSADRLYTENLAEQDAVLALLDSADDTPHGAHVIGEPAYTIENHKQFLELNLQAASGAIEQVNLRGRERGLGLTTGYRTQVDPRSVRLGQTHAGNHCRVDKSAQMHGTVVLNSSVVIDRNTHVEDSVVLENTYVGEHLNLKRCVISGRYIIRVDDNVVVKLADSFMAAPLNQGVYSTHLAGPVNQLCGAIAGAAALPVMAVALLVALWENPYQPLVKRTWVSNLSPKSGTAHRNFDTFEFNVSNRALRKLPQILDIGTGHLRWFGVSAATAAELDARTEPWQMARDNCPSGMLGSAQINEDESATANERFSSDADYAASAHCRLNLELVGAALAKLWVRDTQPKAQAPRT